MNEEELYTFFNECGQVKGVRVVRDKVRIHHNIQSVMLLIVWQKTTIGLGIAYVLFDKRDQAQLALGLTGQKLRSRVCVMLCGFYVALTISIRSSASRAFPSRCNRSRPPSVSPVRRSVRLGTVTSW